MAWTPLLATDTGPWRGVEWARAPRRRLAVAFGTAVIAAAMLPLSPGANPSRRSAVIVIESASAIGARVEAAVTAAGGTVGRRLGIIHGFTADVPASSIAVLQRTPGVASISPDQRVRPESVSYDPTTDAGSPYALTSMTGARRYWSAGYTGAGVGVALIDSGVVPVDGLTAPGKVVNGPDLSFESQTPPLRYLDTFGHGTAMAGIIAGRSGGATPAGYATDTTDFLGMAPGAHIVNVKVADAHGMTDVSQVIAAIDWVVQHRNDKGLNIRVINLSYGTNTAQPYTIDPLAYAAEQAWKAGIFVVAAAGNAGFANIKTSSMTDPAYDPTIMAVGAADPNGTFTTSDDTVATFSSNGTEARRPDVVAPGAHIVSLRDPGSYIDRTYASTGAVTDTLFRGSGTSQATAVVSGAAALVIQQRPTITPDQLKALLKGTATSLKGTIQDEQGRGELDLAKALTANVPGLGKTSAPSTGAGSLDAARGSVHPINNGVALTGEQDIFGHAFDSTAMAAAEAAGSSWSGGTWNGSSWSGSSWSGSSWSGSSWSGSSWSGSSWSGSSWSGSSWSGSSWSGSSWSGSSWSGSSWSGTVWADAGWR